MLQECKRSETSTLDCGRFWALLLGICCSIALRGNMRTFFRNLCEQCSLNIHIPNSTFGAIKRNPGFKSRNQIFLFLLPQWFLQLNQFAKKTRGAVGSADPSAAFIITLVFHLFDFSPLCAKKNRVRTNKAICSLVSPLLDRIPYSRHCGRRHLAPAPPP